MGTKIILCYVLLSIIGKQSAAKDASGSYCNPGQPGDGKCGKGEGDCDNDEQCLPGLKCGVDNCPKKNGMPRNFDCCYRPTPGKKCATSDASGSCCNPGYPGDGKCGEDEGDCDSDAHCLPGLKCGDDNCPEGNGMPNNFDCCYRPTPAVDGVWTHWGSCKGGEQRRTCTNPPPSYDGKGCYGRNIRQCNRHIDCGVVGGWTPWGSCSKSCKGGEQKRMCTMCDGRRKKRCNRNINCAVNGSWTPWGSCSKSCKGGEQKRLCTNPPPSYGGRRCDGRNSQECNININCLALCSRSHYTTLNDAWRKIDYNNRWVNKTYYNDDKMTKGWYRLEGEAGTQLPTHPSTNGARGRYCGTYAPAYMLTDHPTPQEGIVSTLVCFDQVTYTWRYHIKVAACHGEDNAIFYVYELSPPSRTDRGYCGL